MKSNYEAIVSRVSLKFWNTHLLSNKDSKKWVPEVPPTVDETLDTLHKSEGDYFEEDNDYQ